MSVVNPQGDGGHFLPTDGGVSNHHSGGRRLTEADLGYLILFL